MADISEALSALLWGAGNANLPGAFASQPPGWGAQGLASRLISWFPGDPCGPNNHLTGMIAATGLTRPSDAVSAIVSVTGADVFMSLDGTNASATNGLRLPAGTVLRLTGAASLASATFLQAAAGAIVDVAYFT